MPSMRSELRASTSVKVLKLAMALCKLSALSERIDRACAARPGRACQSCVAPGSADQKRQLRRSLPSTGGGLAAPPLSVTAAPPVSPCDLDADLGVAADRRAAHNADRGDHLVWTVRDRGRRPVTSPTRMPLNSTAEPAEGPTRDSRNAGDNRRARRSRRCSRANRRRRSSPAITASMKAPIRA